MQDTFVLGNKEFHSRFILGSGKYSMELIKAAVENAGAEIITLAVRRTNTKETENILDFIPKNVTLLPNTSGARDAKEAVRIARMARELGCGDFVKIEIMKDSKYLLPDNVETVKATEILAKEGFIVLDRATSLHPSRKGLMIAVDLEQYSYEPGNKEKIRATEGTVLDRIPPRVRIRANAKVEAPHIMLLIDDPEGSVIEKAWSSVNDSNSKLIYDTDLMQGAGHIKGVYVEEESAIANGIAAGLERILDNSSDGLLFLVGDGNHSLASAKAYWESVREGLPEEARADHPARYALVEVVNIHNLFLQSY